MESMSLTASSEMASAVGRLLADWKVADKTARLWRGDATLWTGGDESNWLGWLDVIDRSFARLDALDEFVQEVLDAGITNVVLLGMGGSSMAPEVIRETFGVQPDYPDLLVLDSTNPAQILSVSTALNLQQTLFVVSSKSGSSLEPNILMDYFLAQVSAIVGADAVGRHFIAITDPGTSLERIASEKKFRRIFHGEPTIGGRFSALSDFGLVPAALLGVDCRRLLQSAKVMADACAPSAAIDMNPGVQLGCFMGAAALQGRDKLTLVLSQGLISIGAWIEQLVAESVGKNGKGIIPIDGENPAAPDEYGNDRVFVYLRLADSPDARQDQATAALAESGQPVMEINTENISELGAAFFYWEFATAVAGAILGVNPFNQPDVEASKVAARAITAACESGKVLPAVNALADDDVLGIYADTDNAAVLTATCGSDLTVTGLLRTHLQRLEAGDYFGLLAYLCRDEMYTERLNRIRDVVRQARGVATCLGFGPRFLHSTGQVYKGGINSGVFLQLTADPGEDLRVPGRACTFGVITAAQAAGDFGVMASRGRRIVRVHLGADIDAGLTRLGEILSDINQ